MNREGRGVPSEVLQQIRDRIDLVELISSYVSLTKAGQNFKGLCPFHSEKSPSFSVSPARQMFYCFGCSVGGDAFTFLMKQEGLDFMEAVRELSQRSGVPLPVRTERSSPSVSGVSRERYFQIYETAAGWYHQNLLKSPEGRRAREYLLQRGITEESWERFQLGYAPDDWHGVGKWLERQGVKPEELVKTGLSIRKEQSEGGRISIYDRFRSRVIFPISDARGQVIAFGGRTMGTDSTAKYLNSPETDYFCKSRSLYGLPQARVSGSAAGCLYLVEGYFDVITLHQYGLANAVAPLGTALTADHVQMLHRLVPSVRLLFDGDAAGVGAALRTLDLFMNSGVEVRVVLFPQGEDPDSFMRTNGVQAFRELEEKAPTLLDFAITSILNKTQQNSIQDRIKRADDILAILHKTKNPIEKDEYLKILSERLGIRQELLQKRMPTLRIAVPGGKPSHSAPEKPLTHVVPKGKAEERDLIILLLQGRLEADHLAHLEEEKFTVELYREIVRHVEVHREASGLVDVESLRGDLTSDPVFESAVSQLCVWEMQLENQAEHIQGCLRTLEGKWLQRILEGVTTRLKTAEREGRQEEVDRLNAEINALLGRKAVLMAS
ncbi:MAG: DNA primase [Nitrospira sp.]|nr:DNA primase [Nitrospira sp.]MCB9709835.1 DNA primase [Nitrospiraceae bacterium]MDR4485958.1 DNA primase [Nitrospirales bacterium]